MPIDSQVISYTDEEKVLMDQIMKLPKDYRNIICLYYYEGYKIKEIADPWYTGNFDQTYIDVLEGCEGILSSSKLN